LASFETDYTARDAQQNIKFVLGICSVLPKLDTWFDKSNFASNSYDMLYKF